MPILRPKGRVPGAPKKSHRISKWILEYFEHECSTGLYQWRKSWSEKKTPKKIAASNASVEIDLLTQEDMRIVKENGILKLGEQLYFNYSAEMSRSIRIEAPTSIIIRKIVKVLDSELNGLATIAGRKTPPEKAFGDLLTNCDFEMLDRFTINVLAVTENMKNNWTQYQDIRDKIKKSTIESMNKRLQKQGCEPKNWLVDDKLIDVIAKDKWVRFVGGQRIGEERHWIDKFRRHKAGGIEFRILCHRENSSRKCKYIIGDNPPFAGCPRRIVVIPHPRIALGRSSTNKFSITKNEKIETAECEALNVAILRCSRAVFGCHEDIKRAIELERRYRWLPLRMIRLLFLLSACFSLLIRR